MGEEYRRLAEECEQAAAQTDDSVEKYAYGLLAKQWRQLAKDVSVAARLSEFQSASSRLKGVAEPGTFWNPLRMIAWNAGFIAPCLPNKSKVPPSGSEWVHEIKHDGYRLMVRREGGRVQLLTRRGYNWTGKYPRIAEAAARLKVDSFLIDGEAVCCGADGISDFDRLHSRQFNDEVFLYSFDLLHFNGEDYRGLPLHERKARLQRLLAESHGIRFSEHLKGHGPTIFEHICKMGLEGIVSKRRDLGYESGRSASWVKVLNPRSAARRRYREGTF